MTTMNISLPESLKAFIDEQVGEQGFSSTSEYLRDLVRREKERLSLRRLLLEGGASPHEGLMDKAFFDGLRAYIRNATKA
jgi:antitoxin ParD1/3/4